MGATAENLHDRFPQLTKEARTLRGSLAAAGGGAWTNGVMRETVVPMSVFTDDGWRLADRDEFLRPDTSLEGLAELPTPFRAGGRVTAGNSAGLTDGATACLLAPRRPRTELGLEPDAPGRLRVRGRRAGADGHRADSGDRGARASRGSRSTTWGCSS